VRRDSKDYGLCAPAARKSSSKFVMNEDGKLIALEKKKIYIYIWLLLLRRHQDVRCWAESVPDSLMKPKEVNRRKFQN